MKTIRSLERTIAQLPLGEREELLAFIEANVSDEHDRLTKASLAADIRMVEKKLAESKVEIEQVNILDIGKAGTDHSEDRNEAWELFRQDVFAELRRIH